MVHYPTRLNAKLAALPSVVAQRPTPRRPARRTTVFADLSGRIDRQIEAWRDVREG